MLSVPIIKVQQKEQPFPQPMQIIAIIKKFFARLFLDKIIPSQDYSVIGIISNDVVFFRRIGSNTKFCHNYLKMPNISFGKIMRFFPLIKMNNVHIVPILYINNFLG